MDGRPVWCPENETEIASLLPAEIASLVAGIDAIWFGCGAMKFAPTWTSQGGKPKQRRCSSYIFWFPNLLPPGRARVESLSSNADAYPGGFQIRPPQTPSRRIPDFNPEIENAQLQNLRVGLTFQGVFCDYRLTFHR